MRSINQCVHVLIITPVQVLYLYSIQTISVKSISVCKTVCNSGQYSNERVTMKMWNSMHLKHWDLENDYFVLICINFFSLKSHTEWHTNNSHPVIIIYPFFSFLFFSLGKCINTSDTLAVYFGYKAWLCILGIKHWFTCFFTCFFHGKFRSPSQGKDSHSKLT